MTVTVHREWEAQAAPPVRILVAGPDPALLARLASGAAVDGHVAHSVTVAVARPERADRPLERSSRARARDGRVSSIFFLADLVTLLALVWPALQLAGVLRGGPVTSVASRPAVLLMALGALPFFAIFGLYSRGRRVGRAMTADFTEILLAMSMYCFLLLQVLHGSGQEDSLLYDGDIFAYWLLCLAVVPLERMAVRRRLVPRLGGRERTLIVGAGRVGQKAGRAILRRPDMNLDLVGFIDSEPRELHEELAGTPVLGGEDELMAIAERERADRVILTFSRTRQEEVVELMRWSRIHRIHISVVPNYFEVMTSQVEVDHLDGIPVLDLRPARLSRAALATKRVTDVGLTLLALPILLPAFGLIAMAIKLDSRGPVFFRQPRAGRNGRTFRIFKFRTMCVDAEAQRATLLDKNEMSGPLFKIKADPRITRVGAFLRKTSLDELPQLINVLKGEMSLVGPRPFVVYEDELITGWGRRRLDLTPGITGLWQVMGRNDMPFEEMIKLDHLYATRWSLLWDLKILLKTVPSVLCRRGAY